MMYGLEKSDSAIVAMKPANKADPKAAERVEPRAGTKGNTDWPTTYRTQRRSKRVPKVKPCTQREVKTNDGLIGDLRQ